MLFDVAVWPVWSHEVEGYVSIPDMAVIDAPDAFTAIERVMRSIGVRFARHVAAAALDHSIVYRGYCVRLARRGGDGEREQASVGQASL